jgi:predicted alpha/beta-fold hydrolase
MVGFYLKGKSDTAVSLFHGLSGNADADYFHRTAQVCLDQGHSVFMFNHRGCGEGTGLAKHPYHSGRAEDLSAALDFARAKMPGARHLAIGFSLSGNALLLLMSGKRGSTQPDGAIAVNAPIDLESAGLMLKRGFNRVYDIRFVNRCRAEIAARRRADPGMRRYKISPFATLHDFDNLYTAQASGFRDREDYYRTCSTQELLTQIDRPTVLLTAKDDPFVDYRNYAEAKLSPHVTLHIEEVGGHMGYLSAERTPLGTKRWQDYALGEALRVLGQAINSPNPP